MGLGKTVATLTAIDYLIYKDLDIRNALVVAPKYVVENVWPNEINKWSHLTHLRIVGIVGTQSKRIEALQKQADIYLVSRDNFAWLCSFYGGRYLPFDMLVFDELSSFKSYKSVRFKAAKHIRPSAKRVVGLTGTPAPNGLLDLWPQMYLIDMGERLEKSITRYRSLYFKPGQSNGQIVFNYNLIPDGDKRIHDKIKDICISMNKQDYLDLPDKIVNFVELKFDEPLRKLYDKFEKDNILRLFKDNESLDISAINAAGLSNKLLQFSNGAVYDDDKNYHVVHDIKLDALEDIIEGANGEPMLVAYQYKSDLERMKVKLKRFNPRTINSEQDIRDWNDRKIQVLLVHPASMGHGLNLQEGGHLITWFGLTWSLELYMQLVSRLHRQGQTQPVIVNILIMVGTHDEDVKKAIENKTIKQGQLMDAVKARIQKYKNDFRYF
jgi:SNF2 family DNA or RNA helicase